MKYTGKDIFYSIIVVIVLLVVGGVGFVFIQQSQPEQATIGEPAVIHQEAGLGSQLNQNPASKVPDVNPFQEVKTNPFENYKNPFE